MKAIEFIDGSNAICDDVVIHNDCIEIVNTKHIRTVKTNGGDVCELKIKYIMTHSIISVSDVISVNGDNVVEESAVRLPDDDLFGGDTFICNEKQCIYHKGTSCGVHCNNKDGDCVTFITDKDLKGRI